MISDGPSVMRLATFVNGYPFKPEQLGDEGLPVVRIRHLLDEDVETEFAKPPDRAVYITDGDLVFSWSATLAVRRWTRGRALLNQHLFRVDPLPHVHPRWLHYVLEVGIERLKPLMHGSAMTHITQEILRTLTVRVPSQTQQRATAEVLDAETARIDALVAKNCQLIGVLKDRRLAATAAGVSGRLHRASSDLVESPLPWLDDQLTEWRTAKLTLVAELGSGHTPSRNHPEWWENCTIPWITTGEVGQLREDRTEYITHTREMISELGTANSAAEVHPAGTVVLSRTASAGFSAIMGGAMATSQDYVTWTCGPLVRPRFLLLCLRAMRPDLLGRLAQGSTHKTIYMPDIESIRIPLPPVEEQDMVVDETWRRLRSLDAATDVLGRQIALLQERRQALITAAITGQVNIPGLAA